MINRSTSIYFLEFYLQPCYIFIVQLRLLISYVGIIILFKNKKQWAVF